MKIKPKIKIDKNGALHISRSGLMTPVFCYLDKVSRCKHCCSQFVEPRHYAHGGQPYVRLNLCQVVHECNEDEFIDERKPSIGESLDDNTVWRRDNPCVSQPIIAVVTTDIGNEYFLCYIDEWFDPIFLHSRVKIGWSIDAIERWCPLDVALEAIGE